MQCRLPWRIPERSLADQISAGGVIRVHAGFRLAFRMKWHRRAEMPQREMPQNNIVWDVLPVEDFWQSR